MLLQYAKLILAMTNYNKGDALRIQHSLKVHNLAAAIATLEELDEHDQFILETAAILHDTGIRASIKKFGSYTWKSQEEEGPYEAEKLMREIGNYTEEEINRVKFLIAHHHTYNINDPALQILIEADLLVNLFESKNREKYEAIIKQNFFKTSTGKRFLHDMFKI